jgi:hypothetical protein
MFLSRLASLPEFLPGRVTHYLISYPDAYLDFYLRLCPILLPESYLDTYLIRLTRPYPSTYSAG